MGPYSLIESEFSMWENPALCGQAVARWLLKSLKIKSLPNEAIQLLLINIQINSVKYLYTD
jgi:hypothetical protein